MQRKPRLKKTYLATLLALLLAATVLLAISIQSIEFSPARGAPPAYSLFEGDGEAVPELPGIAGETGGTLDLKAPNFTPFAALFFGVMIFVVLLSRDGRRQMFSAMLRGLIVGLALYYLAPRMDEILGGLLSGVGRAQDGADSAALPPMPAIFQVVASLPFALLLTFVGWRLYQRFRPKPAHTKSNFMWEVQSSLDELDAGGDLRDTILGCYRAMIAQARRERLISDDQTATSLELERKLVGYGLPQHETGRLTRLFEDVRYGTHQASERERREARDCLVAFIKACEIKFGQPEPTTL